MKLISPKASSVTREHVTVVSHDPRWRLEREQLHLVNVNAAAISSEASHCQELS